MNGNANYLVSPNKFSTKVAYAPGGHSSFSLVWDTPDTSTSKHKSKLIIPNNNYQISQNRQNYPQNQISKAYEMPKRQYQPEQNQLEYYQGKKESYITMSESNRLLEEQLLYYQKKNKMLRQNIFGGYQNFQKIGEHANRHPQFEKQPLTYSPYNHQNSYSEQYRRGQQQLDYAVIEQKKKRQKQRINSQSSYLMKYNSKSSGHDYPQQKTSVKVNNPPGGRSSIVFG